MKSQFETNVAVLAVIACILFIPACTMKREATGNPERGKQLFDSTCDACHYANSKVARAGPGLQDLYKKKTLMTGAPVTDANMDRWIRDGSHLMPGYGNKISPEQMRDLIAYLKTL
jgi:mono/diheme cytochrome c family protein